MAAVVVVASNGRRLRRRSTQVFDRTQTNQGEKSMVAVVAVTKGTRVAYGKTITLTMVLPAPNGCNLKCGFCAIEQRGEERHRILTPKDYLRFLEDVHEHMPVTRLSLQGHEVLLPEVWQDTRDLLSKANDLDLETRMVTNGTFLAEHAEELSTLTGMVAISLDSPNPEIHERLRGVPGCFEQTVCGIEVAIKCFDPEQVVVNSVLFPGKSHYLEGMPEFLFSMGVREWSIGPYKDMRTGKTVEDHTSLKKDLLLLTEKGERAGLKVFLADELRRLDIDDFYEGILVASLEEDTYVVRLSPDATCSLGMRCFNPSTNAPVWDRIEVPHLFLRRVLAEVGQEF